MSMHILTALLAATILTAAAPSHADYPERPIRLVVSFSAGSITDTVARLLADGLHKELGQTVIVENKPGATGNIGAQKVATSKPDGYTLLMHSSALAVNPWLSSTSYDLMKDLTPVTRVAGSPYVVTVKQALPVHTLDDFLQYAASHPGKLTCATYGIGSPPHLALALLKEKAHLDIVHVAYSSFSKALTDLVSGQLDCSIYPPGTVAPYVKDGKIRAVGIMRTEPLASMPEALPLPASLQDASVDGYQLIFVPSGTDPAIIRRLQQSLTHIIHSPDFAKRLHAMGFEPIGDTSEHAASVFANDYQRFGPIVQALHLSRN